MPRSTSLLAVAALATCLAVPILSGEEAIQIDARLARHLALAEELEAEGAPDEAQYVRAAADAGAHAPDVGMDLRPANGQAATAPRRRGGVGGAISWAVVGFYRSCVAPAIGARCVLEPSCSQYFLEASRKHGLLGIPMIADRFVREPPESHSDRLVRRPDGSWRHADPVEEHDWWF